MKHTAKKIEAGDYEYRGYQIWRNGGYDGWHINSPNAVGNANFLCDITNTLNEAKVRIDYYENSQRSGGAS